MTEPVIHLEGKVAIVTGASRGIGAEIARTFARAVTLFERYGGLALVIGRFLGPVSGLVPIAAALSGMAHRRFLLWSIVAFAFPLLLNFASILTPVF